jgi:general secretion pathway protein I
MTEPRKPNGFTLVEILVAFTIMALMLGALLQTFGAGLRSLGLAESYATAALHARSKAAEIGQTIPIEAGEHSGELDHGFQWRAVVAPYEPATPAGIPGGPRLAGFQVDVTVSWEGERAVSLRTLRLARER